MEGNDVHANVQPQKRNMRGRTGASQRLLDQVPPTNPKHSGGERFACKCTASEAQNMQRVARTKCETCEGTLELTTIAPARHDHQRQGCRRNCSALRAASEHCAASCGTLACAKLQTTNAWTRFLRMYVEFCVLQNVCMLYVVCGCILVRRAHCVRCQVCRVCCVCVVKCVGCVGTRVVYVASSMARESCMLRVLQNVAENQTDDTPQ